MQNSSWTWCLTLNPKNSVLVSDLHGILTSPEATFCLSTCQQSHALFTSSRVLSYCFFEACYDVSMHYGLELSYEHSCKAFRANSVRHKWYPTCTHILFSDLTHYTCKGINLWPRASYVTSWFACRCVLFFWKPYIGFT